MYQAAHDAATTVALLDLHEARNAVALALGVPVQVLDVWPENLEATYRLRSDEVLTLRAEVWSTARTVEVTLSAFFEDDRETEEVADIHATIAEAMPAIASILSERSN